MKRKQSFKVLTGSHNYNLNTPESDLDYKVFFYPTFEDLYSGDKSSKASTSVEEDISFHDVRKLPDMLWKSNVNFIEVLFSQQAEFTDSLYIELFDKREGIARMNLPYLYDACIGMFYQKYKDFQRDTKRLEQDQSNEELIKKVNKHAMSGFRILDFLYRYQHSDFNSFQDAIYYHEQDDYRNILFNFRNGEIHAPENRLLQKKSIIEGFKNRYKDNEPDMGMKQYIDETVKKYVREQIKYELGD